MCAVVAAKTGFSKNRPWGNTWMRATCATNQQAYQLAATYQRGERPTSGAGDNQLASSRHTSFSTRMVNTARCECVYVSQTHTEPRKSAKKNVRNWKGVVVSLALAKRTLLSVTEFIAFVAALLGCLYDSPTVYLSFSRSVNMFSRPSFWLCVSSELRVHTHAYTNTHIRVNSNDLAVGQTLSTVLLLALDVVDALAHLINILVNLRQQNRKHKRVPQPNALWHKQMLLWFLPMFGLGLLHALTGVFVALQASHQELGTQQKYKLRA